MGICESGEWAAEFICATNDVVYFCPYPMNNEYDVWELGFTGSSHMAVNPPVTGLSPST